MFYLGLLLTLNGKDQLFGANEAELVLVNP
jgi:hypothetical protein